MRCMQAMYRPALTGQASIIFYFKIFLVICFENNHPLSCWPSIHNSISKICSKFQVICLFSRFWGKWAAQWTRKCQNNVESSVGRSHSHCSWICDFARHRLISLDVAQFSCNQIGPAWSLSWKNSIFLKSIAACTKLKYHYSIQICAGEQEAQSMSSTCESQPVPH